jgi:hypothetical protein
VRGRVDVRADVLGQDEGLQAVLVALDQAGVVDDVELRVREEARHRRAQRRRQVDGLEAVQGGDERIDRVHRRIHRRGHVLSPPGRLRDARLVRPRAAGQSDARGAVSAGRPGMMARMEATTTDAAPSGGSPFAKRLDRYFDITARGSTIPTEVRAGAATFLTMAYILFVNPQILGSVAAPGGVKLPLTSC